jgi:hypothetical protein
MKTKRNNPHSDGHQQYDDVEYALYCDALEGQYKEAKEESLFEVLKVLELDKEHSDRTLVQAIDYFNEKNGLVEKDAPMGFLTEREKSMLHRDGKFRPELYCMLLSGSFSEAIQNKSVFLKDSLKFTFDKP